MSCTLTLQLTGKFPLHRTMNTKNCQQCNKEFQKPYQESVKAWVKRHKFCSKACVYASWKGKKSTFPSHLGRKLTEEHKKKISQANSGEKAYQWKGGFNCSKKRRARINGAEGTHSETEWAELKKKYNYMCLCCKAQEPFVKLCEDHIVPLSVGGSNDISNIQPLCKSCNSRKFTKVIDYTLSFWQVTVA